MRRPLKHLARKRPLRLQKQLTKEAWLQKKCSRKSLQKAGGSAVVEPEADVAAALEDKTEEEPTALDESGLSRRTPLRSAHAPILMKVAGANYLDSATVSKKVNGIWVQASEVTVGDEVRVDLSFSFPRNTITSTDKDVTYTLPSGIRPEKALTRRHQ